MDQIPRSELILNQDGSVYHLRLKPGDIAQTIITVGDPDRVERVSRHFDSIELRVEKREFITHTGSYKGKPLTVISTGIGTDNIDIVFNELDALVNIDFNTRTLKSEFTALDFIRIGTSGAIQADIPVDSFIVSEKAVGFDGLLYFYGNTRFLDTSFSEALVQHLQWNSKKSTPYVVSGSEALAVLFTSEAFRKGITATNVGFYGPQGRKLRMVLEDENLNSKLQSFRYDGRTIDNMEMETSAMYGLAQLLGHRAISLNAIIANRSAGTFSENPRKIVDRLIKRTLDLLVL